jgi:sphinganine-1-phosphate aldolase
VIGTTVETYIKTRRFLYGLFLRAPGVRGKVQQQINSAVAKLEGKFVPSGPDVKHYRTLPKEPWTGEAIASEIKSLSNMEHTRWEDGFVSGAVYHGGSDLLRIQAQAFETFGVANPLHPDVFPGVRKMEAEIVAMVLALFHAPSNAAGVTTSGGTESILMACLSARQKAYAERGVTEPEMILPETAHTAFHKAGAYFKIKVHLVECPGPNYQVDVRRVTRLINSNTVLLVGSAPNFPHGIIDDISALSRLALRKKLPLHVDCCLGSFLVPFLARAGFPTEPFDFSLKGVTSISCDTHKYGFAPKGNSTVLYRTKALRAYQYSIFPNWTGGVYASPSIAGSRPGALIAGCWASLMAVGEKGYIDATYRIVGAAKELETTLRTHAVLSAELVVMGHPKVSVVAFAGSPHPKAASASSQPLTPLSIYDIADAMSKKGWHLNALQNPPAVHIAITLPTVSTIPRLIADLASCVAELRSAERARVAAGHKPKGAPGGDAAALYGVAGSLPDKSIVEGLARGFLDTLYKT